MDKFLEKVQLFKDLSNDELEQLSKLVSTEAVPASTLLFEENSTREALFIVKQGEILLSKKSLYGTEKRLNVFRKYDFFGESALFDQSPRTTSARALTDAIYLRIQRTDFLTFLQKNPSVAAKIYLRISRVITRRMQSTSTLLANEAAQYASGRVRSEYDMLGSRDIPHEAYYGIQTLRALENFHITGVPISHYPTLIEALASVKMAAAKANRDLNLIPINVAEALVQSCHEILQGRLRSHFVVDMLQGGAGTSTNMNANEVIANRALEIMGYEKGEYTYCHPNNHVNCSQSTNDAYPTALKIAILKSNRKLIRALEKCIASFQGKARQFDHIIKMGRTQLQDAVPMTLGQEFAAYAVTLSEEIERLEQNAHLFLEVNMGGTAIGTGLNTVKGYRESVIKYLREITGFEIVSAPDLIEATQDTGAFLMFSSSLKRLATKLSKICNDLRLLSSGPRAGLNEINLPKAQPGSSIMPGKVNPVIPEVVNQIAFKVIGNDLTVTLAAEAGQLELNVMEPVIAQSIFESIEMLRRGITTLKFRCIDGIEANEAQCKEFVQKSIGVVTALVPVLGYETCSELAKQALELNRGIYELVLERGILSREELDRILDPRNMLSPA